MSAMKELFYWVSDAHPAMIDAIAREFEKPLMLTWENPKFSPSRLDSIADIKSVRYQDLLANCYRLCDVNHANANFRNTNYRRKTTATMMIADIDGRWKIF